MKNILVIENAVLVNALAEVKEQLGEFATGANFDLKMRSAFGSQIDTDGLKQAWLAEDFSSFPEIKILTAAEMGGANGAYAVATNTIYLSREFLFANQSNTGVVAAVLLEEYGHFVDSQINAVDASGDEGAIFAALVRDEDLSNSELQQLKNEDDSAVVTIDGEEVEVEQNIQITQLTNNNIVDVAPAISGDKVVWAGYDGNDTEIYLYDGNTTRQLTNNNTDDYTPAISGDKVVWVGEDGNDREIYLYDGNTTRQLTNNNIFDYAPAISGDKVVWAGYDGNDTEIYLYDGNTTRQLTNNNTNDYEPAISGDKVVWSSVIDRYNSEIYLYDGNTTRQLTNNNIFDVAPAISGDKVVWVGEDRKNLNINDREIYLYDGNTIRQLTNNNINDYAPDISGDKVVWSTYDGTTIAGNEGEIYLYDGNTIRQLTNNNTTDQSPAISGDKVVWQNFVDKDLGWTHFVPNDMEIYLANLSTSDDTSPLVIEADGGDFEDDDEDGIFEPPPGASIIYVGRDDGIRRMLRIEGSTSRYDDDSLTITGGTVYSEIAGISAPLFTIDGSLDIPFNTATGTFTESNSPNDFEIGGLDVNFDSISLQPSALGESAIILDGDFTLPSNLLNIQVAARGDNALYIDRQGIGFGSASGTIPLQYQNPGLQLFANLGIVPGTLNLSYEEQDNKLLLNGKIGVSTSLITAFQSGNTLGTTFTLNLDRKDSKFIQVHNGIADIDGTIEAKNLKLLFGFKLPDFKATIESTDGILTDIGGTTSIKLPFFKGKAFRNSAIDIDLKGKVQPEITVDKVVLTGKGLNIRIPRTPFFLNEITGGLINLNPAANETIDYQGSIGISLLPNTKFPIDEDSLLARIFNLRDIDASLVRGKFDLTAGLQQPQINSSGELVAIKAGFAVSLFADELIKHEGNVQWDWQQKFIKGSLEANLLSGFLVTQANFNVDYQTNNFSIVASATAGRITFPNNALFLGAAGKTFVDGVNYGLKYTNDGNSFNDIVAAWTAVNIPFVGDGTLGFKFNFNGDSDLIFSAKEIPIFNSWQIEPETAWIIISASWENTVDRDVRVRVIDESGNSIEEADFAANNIAIVEDLSNSNTRTVVIDSPNAGVWDLEIVDDSDLGEVEFTAFEDTSAPTIDILSVSPNSDNTGSFIINYNASDADSEAAITLFYDTDNEDFDGAIIADDLVEQDGEGSFVWTPGDLAPGEYYVYATILDENNAPVSQYAPEPIEITDSADLAISRDISDEPVSVGAELTYTLTVINNGEDLARNVSITEVLPEGARFVSATVDSSPQEDNSVNLNLGDLANGESTSVDIAIAAPNVIGSATINSLLDSDTFDPVLGNDDDIAVIDIINSEGLPEIRIDDVSGLESDDLTEIIFNVSLSQEITETITVDYATANITAIAGEDYTAANGTLEFAPGETEKTIAVEIIGDAEAEPDETFVVNLSNASNSAIANSVGTATIENDDRVLPSNKIEGTSGRDVLTGSDEDDEFIGSQSRDRMTGGAGGDRFVYTSIVYAGDIITDFEVGSDQIVLTELLNSFDYQGSNAITDGYVQFASRGSHTLVQIDADGFAGSGSSRSFLLVENVTVAELNNTDNFVF